MIEFKNAIQIDSQYLDAHKQMVETYLKLGDPKGAFREYMMIEKLDPDNLNAKLKRSTKRGKFRSYISTYCIKPRGNCTQL